MESNELREILSLVDKMFQTLQAAYWKIFEANAWKGNEVTFEMSEISGELAELSRELTILVDSLIIAESNLKDPHTPPDRLADIKRKYESDKIKADKMAKKAEKVLNKAQDIITKSSGWQPDTKAPMPEAPKEQKQKQTITPSKTPTKTPQPAKKSLIEEVHSGNITSHNLPVSYYNSEKRELLSAVKKGMRNAKGFEELYESLNLNAQSFAAAKTYNLVKDLEGLKSDPDYMEKAKARVKLYDTWSEAEINTAQQQTHQAKQWQIITEDSDLFPILKYSTIGDACKICRPLDGITAPVNSSIWKKIYPCNHYNCYCIVTQETKGTELTESHRMAQLVTDSSELMSPVFLSNPGITKQLFTNKHPYFATVPKSDRAFAKENFGLPIK